ncbi:MAG: alpha/beta hydrolase [Acidimicrobiales bacterium]|nr:alpha/beta hydrolase [Acidimicrobiales bacterium]
MTQVAANGLLLEVEEFGETDAPPVLLIAGLNAQLTVWREGFCRQLADRGHRVVRFDNRDVGLSSWLDQHPTGDPVDAYLSFLNGEIIEPPYSLADMAADAVGVLDALSLDSAHVVGGSFGGMIAQRMAIHAPARLRSLTSIMSMPRMLPLDLEVVLLLQSGEVDPEDHQAIEETALVAARRFAGTRYPVDEDDVRRRSIADVNRGVHPDGATRQVLAVLADGDRRDLLAAVELPTLVIHGTEDPLIPTQGGEETANSVSNAELVWIDGMGHDWPEEAWPQILNPICKLISQVEMKR